MIKRLVVFLVSILWFGSNLSAQLFWYGNFDEDTRKCRINDSLSVFSKWTADLEAYGREETGNIDESGHCNNRPFKTQGKFSQKGFFIWIDTSELFIGKDSFLCHPLYMVNNSDSMMRFMTNEGSLFLSAEGINSNGEWEALGDLPAAFCGNSYYEIYLDTNEYWRFEIPVFHGSVNTRLRYSLGYDQDLFQFNSNEIPVFLNKEQFYKAQNTVSSDSYYYQIPPAYLNREAVVSQIGFNVVYYDLNNYLSIAVPGYKQNQIKVESSIGSIVPVGNGSDYVLKIKEDKENVRIVSIKVSVHKLFKWEEQCEYEFRIRKVPLPEIMFGDIEQSGAYSKGKLNLVSFVGCPLKDFPLEGVKFKPLKYEVLVIGIDGKETLFMGEGGVLSPVLRKAIRSCKSGDKIILQHVEAIGPNGAVKLNRKLEILVD